MILREISLTECLFFQSLLICTARKKSSAVGLLGDRSEALRGYRDLQSWPELAVVWIYLALVGRLARGGSTRLTTLTRFCEAWAKAG